MGTVPELPLIIGYRHSGEGRARALIGVLEKNGLRDGDVIALEGLSRHETDKRTVFDLWESEAHGKQRLEEGMRLAARAGVDHILHLYENRINKINFHLLLADYLASKNVKVVGWDIFSSRVRKLDKVKNEKLKQFLQSPIREKIGSKSLKVTNPRFILCGSGHAPALGKLVPNRGVITLSNPIHVGASLARTKYKLRQTWRKTKRRFSRK